MSDDLGRGMLNWPAEKWQRLDTIANETVTAHVVMRNVVDHQEAPDAYNVRIGGQDVSVTVKSSKDFAFDQATFTDEDLESKIRRASQDLASEEDKEVLGAMKPDPANNETKMEWKSFGRAKGKLGDKFAVKYGFGGVINSLGLASLETEATPGPKSGLELTEQLLNTKLVQTTATVGKYGEFAYVFQSSPPAWRLVHATPPRVRVKAVTGSVLTLAVEERIAVKELEKDRQPCVAIVV